MLWRMDLIVTDHLRDSDIHKFVTTSINGALERLSRGSFFLKSTSQRPQPKASSKHKKHPLRRTS